MRSDKSTWQRSVLGLVSWLLLCLAAGAIGAFASADAGVFYRELIRPDWAPPAWLFGPVWSILYVMMALSAFIIWRDDTSSRHRVHGLTLFIAQLAVNALWSWLFFAWQMGGIAFGGLVLLWCLIVATILVFRKINRAAAYLLLPYLFWVTFAGALNFVLWRSNAGLLG